jgi:hypothetical protein
MEAAWKALDGYAMHTIACPGDREAVMCDCGLTATRVRLRAAALNLVEQCAAHEPGCSGTAGKRCRCGLDDARRRLRSGLAKTG